MDTINLREFDKKRKEGEAMMPPPMWPIHECHLVITPSDGDRSLLLKYIKVQGRWVFTEYKNV